MMDMFSCLKYSLLIFCVILGLSGIALIVGGAIVLSNVEGITAELPTSYIAPPIIFIFAGVMAFAVAVMGCCGALKESVILVLVFGILLVMLFIIVLAAAVTAAVTKDPTSENLKVDMAEEMVTYSRKRSSKKFWDRTQKNFKCCGIDSPLDWNDHYVPEITTPTESGATTQAANGTAGNGTAANGTAANGTSQAPGQPELPPIILVPPSCCHLSNVTQICLSIEIMAYTEGCLPKLHDTMITGAHIIMGIGIAVAVLLLLGIVIAFWLAVELREEDYYDDDDYDDFY